jgi:hypothetical protein
MHAWTSFDRRLGVGSALAVFIIGAVYVTTGAIGVAIGGGSAGPNGFNQVDPYRAILEVLIILCAPPMVILMAAVHTYAPPGAKTHTLAALAFMVLLAGVTVTIHFVQLTVTRRVDLEGMPGLSLVLALEWPTIPFVLDLLAWDVFLGLSLLCAAPAFGGGRQQNAVRASLTLSGALCLAGALAPSTGELRLQVLAIAGYAFVFPVACLQLARLFASSEIADLRAEPTARSP